MTWKNGNNIRQKGTGFWEDKEQEPEEQDRVIRGADLDEDFNDMAISINNALAKDGTNSMTGNLNMGNNTIENIRGDIDMGGYKLTNYGNQDGGPTGGVCERQDKVVFTPNVAAEGTGNLAPGEYVERHGFYQIIGDWVMVSAYIRFGNVTTVLADDPIVSLQGTPTGKHNPSNIPFLFPTTVHTSNSSSPVKQGHLKAYEELDGVNTHAIYLTRADGTRVSQYEPSVNEELWVSAIYALTDNNSPLPDS